MTDWTKTANALNGPNPDINEPLSSNEAMAQALMGKVQPVAQRAYDAFTLPGDVMQGKVDPLSNEATPRSMDMLRFILGPTTVFR